MKIVKQFDPMAAEAMRDACGMKDDSTFLDRARKVEFWSVYDPEPIGGVILDGWVIHAGVTRPGRLGFTIRKIVQDAMKSREYLIAPIQKGSHAAERLAQALGFKFHAEHKNHLIYRLTP